MIAKAKSIAHGGVSLGYITRQGKAKVEACFAHRVPLKTPSVQKGGGHAPNIYSVP